MQRRFKAAISVMVTIAMITACGSGGADNNNSNDAEDKASAVERTVAEYPVKEDYPQVGEWNESEAPTHDNGPWAQSYAVFDELKRRADEYDVSEAERVFNLSCHDPEDSGPGEIATAWANAVAVATEGRIKINVGYSGLFSGATTSLDDMKQGTVDFAWVIPCYFDGYMPLTNVIQNPALKIKNGTAASWAMWELYRSSPALQEEYADDGVLLFTCANCTSPLSYKGDREITGVSEIRGNIRANNGPAQIFVDEIGATVFGCPIGDVYNNIQHGIIQYLVTDWNGIDSFALSDPGVLNYYIDTNVGCSAFAMMASDIWDTIDPKLQEDIRSISGDYMLNVVDIWDYWEASGRYKASANGGIIYKPSTEFEKELDEIFGSVAERWINEQEDPVKANELYDNASELVEKYNELYD